MADVNTLMTIVTSQSQESSSVSFTGNGHDMLAEVNCVFSYQLHVFNVSYRSFTEWQPTFLQPRFKSTAQVIYSLWIMP